MRLSFQFTTSLGGNAAERIGWVLLLTAPFALSVSYALYFVHKRLTQEAAAEPQKKSLKKGTGPSPSASDLRKRKKKRIGELEAAKPGHGGDG
jgi:hypothetical protein